MPGKQVGPYRFEQVIVQGKASSLYLAYDVNKNCPAFVEILETTVDQDPQLAQRFRQRMAQVSQLNHPGIAAGSDVGLTATNQPYVATRHVAGELLSKKLTRLSGETFTILEALQLVRQIASALAVAHRAGLVHHDLKPENIIIKEDNTPVLRGWGVLAGPTSTASIGEKANGGGLDYASPEQLQGNEINSQSNIYSLGIILYELLTGHRPQFPISDWDVSATPETYHLVQNCLWPQGRNRFEDMDKMVAAIKAAIWAERLQSVTATFLPLNRRWLYGAIALSIPILLLLGVVLFRAYAGAIFQSDNGPSRIGVPAQNANPSDGTVRVSTGIELLNPPAGGIFAKSDTITFDWSYPTSLEPDQQFVVYILAPDELYRLGTVTQPVIVSLYRLQVKGSDINGAEGTYEWQVVLETASSGENLAESTRQAITLLLETSTPSPSPLPSITRATSATATATGSPTPTPSLTPTPSCTPEPPPGWVTYTVKFGDALFPLATQTGTLVSELQRVNCLEDTVLSVGQVLWLPALPATDTPVATNTPVATPTSVPSPEPSVESSVVQPAPAQPSSTEPPPEPTLTPPP